MKTVFPNDDVLEEQQIVYVDVGTFEREVGVIIEVIYDNLFHDYIYEVDLGEEIGTFERHELELV